MHTSLRILSALFIAAILLLPIHMPHSASAQSAAPPLSISLKGNQFVNASGQAIVPHGVNTNWGGGNGPFPFMVASLQAWNVKMIRFQLDEDCYLAINGQTNCWAGTGPYGSGYRTQVINFEPPAKTQACT